VKSKHLQCLYLRLPSTVSVKTISACCTAHRLNLNALTNQVHAQCERRGVRRDLSHMTNTARKHKQTRNRRFHLNAVADKSRFTTARPKLVYRHFSRSGGASERASARERERELLGFKREMTNRAGYRWSHLTVMQVPREIAAHAGRAPRLAFWRQEIAKWAVVEILIFNGLEFSAII